MYLCTSVIQAQERLTVSLLQRVEDKFVVQYTVCNFLNCTHSKTPGLHIVEGVN
jgi:hypothetical protein